MSIINIQTSQVGLVGVLPSIAYIQTDDPEATVLTTGYLNKEVQQGTQFSIPCLALVSVKETPTSPYESGWYEVSHVGSNWSLVPSSSPGEVVLPTIANHIAVYTNTTGTLSEDPATAISGGNLQAGLSGTAGYFASFPLTAARGSLRLTAVANTGNTLVTISNALHGQASVYSIPDSGAATANFIVSTTAGGQSIAGGLTLGTPLVVASGGSGRATATAYALIAGGTTATGAHQSLASVGTAGQLLTSGGAGALPTWTTATFPVTGGSAGTILRSNGTNFVNSTSTFADTYSVSTILYASSANAVTGLATVNQAALSTNLTGVPTWLALTNGQLVVGSTAGSPAAATLTAGTGVSITNASNSITINAVGGGSTWSTVAGTTQAIAVNNGYVSGNAAQTTFTLPATAAVGDRAAIEGLGAAGWILTANTGQTIKIGTGTTSSAGTLTSVAGSDNVYVICIVANLTWKVQTTNSAGLTIA